MERKTKPSNTVSTKITSKIGKICNQMMKTYKRKSQSLSRKRRSLKSTRKKKSLMYKMNGRTFTTKRYISGSRKTYEENMKSSM
jgi:hypothetical protein